MPIPEAVTDAVSRRVEGGLVPETLARVGGGDINQAASGEDTSGRRWFIKWNASAPADMFEAELDGLQALAGGSAHVADLLRVPRAIAAGETEGVGWLLMEFLDRPETPGAAGARGWEVRLGRGLAEMHRRSARARRVSYGWRRDNYLGRLTQSNPESDDWSAFWRDHRIAPQTEAAHAAGHLLDTEREVLDLLLERMDEVLAGAEREGPSLLHGDLWGGNVRASDDGRAAIYDPAVYRGHREVDLAMSELFGFPSRFMPAYREAWPIDPGYEEIRRDAYQLYYLLAHVNLFGRGYAPGALAVARRVLERV